MSNLLILGAGGFGQMVAETAQLTGQYEKIAFLDDASKDSRVIGKCVDYEACLPEYSQAVAAFGNNKMRLHWVDKLLEAGFAVPPLVHPSAVVSPSAVLEPGCFVMQRAVVNTHTVIEKGCLINAGAIVDHDSRVGAGAHICLGSVVKANCTIEPLVKVEAGQVIFSTRRKIDGVDSLELEDALYAFGFGNQCSYVRPFGAGHINETYAVYVPDGQGGDVPVAHHAPRRYGPHDLVNAASELSHCAVCAAYCLIAPAPAYFSKCSPSVTTSVGACFTPYFFASSAFSSALSFS